MNAVRCTTLGPPESLVVEAVPTPEPGPGEVRLKVAAAGVNFPDTLIIQGLYQERPALPFTPGGEAAGVIDAVGEGVEHVAVGDRMLAFTGRGAFAESLVAPAAVVAPVPEALPLDLAAGFLLAYGTAHHALRQRAQIRDGETLLVLGAAGGVGLAAVELGARMGARVVAAASTDEKLALCRERGAAETINYAEEDLRDGLGRVLGKDKPDVVFDPVGGALSEAAFRSLAWGGWHLVVGFAAGDIPSFPLNLPLVKGAALVGVFWGAFVQREPAVHRANMTELMGWVEAGDVRPHVSERFPLERTGEALRWMMDRKAMGKVIVEMPGE
ncbi:NADPH:quinone oxidoreductase family protein [Rubrivirga marina]|uniref:NADPH:quinone oxidoreductase n=1 Tax=Rubrivirga marina TaxID=1196024 RepID=A0A271IWS8_9BACT|nr:NADPH:quinone oxidoreductase family protein [Rubrivirga marina]PAP74999.1 NADPH:quinone oxidoreductase [Rubrivirga marina]